jgi:hypothetical protein
VLDRGMLPQGSCLRNEGEGMEAVVAVRARQAAPVPRM